MYICTHTSSRVSRRDLKNSQKSFIQSIRQVHRVNRRLCCLIPYLATLFFSFPFSGQWEKRWWLSSLPSQSDRVCTVVGSQVHNYSTLFVFLSKRRERLKSETRRTCRYGWAWLNRRSLQSSRTTHEGTDQQTGHFSSMNVKHRSTY